MYSNSFSKTRPRHFASNSGNYFIAHASSRPDVLFNNFFLINIIKRKALSKTFFYKITITVSQVFQFRAISDRHRTRSVREFDVSSFSGHPELDFFIIIHIIYNIKMDLWLFVISQSSWRSATMDRSLAFRNCEMLLWVHFRMGRKCCIVSKYCKIFYIRFDRKYCMGFRMLCARCLILFLSAFKTILRFSHYAGIHFILHIVLCDLFYVYSKSEIVSRFRIFSNNESIKCKQRNKKFS